MLHPDTGSRDQVLAAIKNASDAFTNNTAAVQEKMQAAFPDDAEREQARQKIAASLGQAHAEASAEETDPAWFTPRNQMAVLAQSAMNTRAVAAAAPLAAGVGAVAAVPDAAFDQYGPADPTWLESVIDSFKTFLTGKAKFVQHQNLTDFLVDIPDQITIALVADWGAHNDAAEQVAAQIRACNPDKVIHLGDIYYAGQDNEAEAMLKTWPLADPDTGAIPSGMSFGLNGNHEMASGGKAYFGKVLEAFGQKASYFGFRNTNWQILAFDTAYVEHRLLPPDEAKSTGLDSQWNWLVDKMQNSKLPTLFLSHHQPVSAFTQEHADATNLRADYKKFLKAAGRPVFGWFFGHEHKCTIYDDPNVPYFARLIGHGAIPHAPPPRDQQPEPGCESFSNMNFRASADGDAVCGFALLKFDGSQIDIRYIDQDGFPFLEEIWQAPPR